MHVKREICKVCGEVNRVGFSVPDEMWEIVTPAMFRHVVVCLTCWTKWADEASVAWDREIKFYPVSRVSLDG